MNITKEKLDFFMENIFDDSFQNNDGGMASPGLFTLYLVLDSIKPKVVVESGVWNGISTKLIRKILPDATIICLDPREIPDYGHKDDNPNTIYYTGESFVDFEKLDLSKYNNDEILCFFDCHHNALERMLQSYSKKVSHLFFNANHPVDSGSQFTLEHFLKHDNRHFLPEFTYGIQSSIAYKKLIKEYTIIPNIYPGSIKTGEGNFDCESYFDKDNDDYPILKADQQKYRWNTHVQILI